MGYRLALAALTLFAVVPLCAQQPTAQVTGIITDASGAVVPGATITVTNVNTGVAATTKSNNSGNYLFPVVQPGMYNIGVQKSGFDQITRTGIELVVSQIARFDFTLRVGAAKQTIEVSAATPPLETQTASLGQVVNTKSIEDLPLNGRNFLQLAKL
ncbi:MAG: carboxypeptidase-like regulatory domain-containing protein, partial [Bryobacteraceae bacterium]